MLMLPVGVTGSPDELSLDMLAVSVLLLLLLALASRCVRCNVVARPALMCSWTSAC